MSTNSNNSTNTPPPSHTVLMTWSPKGTTTKHNIISTVKRHYQIFSICNDWASNFEFNPEYNLNGNIHYHGFIQFSEGNRHAYYSWLHYVKQQGFVKINKVNHDLQQAMVYCRKDRALMSLDLPDIYNPIRPNKYNYSSIVEYMKVHAQSKDKELDQGTDPIPFIPFSPSSLIDHDDPEGIA
jgi:hypothetical protein